MVKDFLRQSPLAHLHLEARNPLGGASPDAGVLISELKHRTQITVRGQSTDPAFMQGIKKALGFALPTQACTAAGKADGLHILWMGPDEWLVVAPPENEPLIMEKLIKALEGLDAALVDVSESRTVIQLSGQQARAVLNKGCSIDLHPRTFTPGQVVNTLLARAHITLHQTATQKSTRFPTYDIYVHRSYAEYMWSWIEDASREYGLEITATK